jgi:hypothetical protein
MVWWWSFSNMFLMQGLDHHLKKFGPLFNHGGSILSHPITVFYHMSH